MTKSTGILCSSLKHNQILYFCFSEQKSQTMTNQRTSTDIKRAFPMEQDKRDLFCWNVNGHIIYRDSQFDIVGVVPQRTQDLIALSKIFSSVFIITDWITMKSQSIFSYGFDCLRRELLIV
jgi:hypothetical protein